MCKIRWLGAGLGLLAVSALAQPVSTPVGNAGEVRVYQVSYLDPTYDPEEAGGIQALVHHESPALYQVEAQWQGEGQARHWVYRRTEYLFTGAVGRWTFEFLPGPHLVLNRFEHTIATPAGKLLRREAYSLRAPELGYPEHLLHPNVLEFAFRGLSFQTGQRVNLSVFLNPQVIYAMEVKVAGRETLPTRFGPQECWKVEMRSGPANYQGVAGLILQGLSPTYTFWFLTAGSHPLIRYEGPLGIVEGVRPMKQVHELVFLRSIEYPSAWGQEPKPPVLRPRPASADLESPFDLPDLPAERRTFKVYFETPPRDLDRQPLNQRLLYLENANWIETESHWLGGGEARRLEYTRVERLNNRCRAEVRFRFLPGGFLRLEEMSRRVTNPAGELVREEYFDFTEELVRYPASLCHPYTLELAFRGLRLAPGVSRSFRLWLGATATLKMTVTVAGRENLRLPDGQEIDCLRLEMIPDLVEYLGGVGKLVQTIVPRYTWWLSAQSPHSQVRYRGPLGQINVIQAPVVIHDLVEWEADLAD